MTLHIRIEWRDGCIGCKGRRSPHIVEDQNNWVGWWMTCLRCGEQWAGDEWMPRPFQRGWRKKNIENAKRLWRAYHPKAAHVPGMENTI